MIYLSDAVSAQSFTFIPRSFAINARLEVKDEETGIVQNNNVAINKLSGYASINVALTLQEDKFYEVTVVSIGSNWDVVDQFWNLTTVNWEEGITRSGSAWNFATDTWTVEGPFSATLSTAAQPNITSVGTLTALRTTGDVGMGIASPAAELHVNEVKM